MVSAIFNTLTEITTSVITWFTSLFNGVTEVFYTAGEGGASGQLTLIGMLALIGVGVGAFYFVLRWIMSLIRVRTKG